MDDLISRQATIEALRGNEPAYEDGEAYIQWEKDFYSIYSINGLQSDRKVGKWMFTDAAPHRVYCSNCYATLVPNKEWLVDYNISTNYCPNCGARMDERRE